MPTTRHALIISNPGERGSENYCKGVYVDVENYYRMLMSEVGGWWFDREVTKLDRPTKSDLRDVLKDLSQDYVFIVFSGHGWYSSVERDEVLELRKGHQICASELVANAKKRTLILDCCQEVHEEAVLEGRIAANAEMYKRFHRRRPDGARCRAEFSARIDACSRAVVKIVSCSQNETASESDTRGGRYNGSVAECVADWTEAVSKSYSSQNDVLSIVRGHQCASEKTIKLSGGTQNPTIERPRSTPYFPLSVFVE